MGENLPVDDPNYKSASDYLQNPALWTDGLATIFYSIGVCMGVMTSLGSYNKKSKPVIFDSILVPCVNSTVSLMAGFAVFATVGYLKHEGNKIVQGRGSFALAFAAYPTALDSLEWKNFWCFILFLTLWTLGVDSCFAILEAISTVIYDATYRDYKLKQWQLAMIICILGVAFSTPFCLNIGHNLSDVVDH